MVVLEVLPVCCSEAVLAEMGVALREDGGTVGVFSPKQVFFTHPSYTPDHPSHSTLSSSGTPAVCLFHSVHLSSCLAVLFSPVFYHVHDYPIPMFPSIVWSHTQLYFPRCKM